MKDQSSFEAWGPQKDQSTMNFGPVGSKCLQFMFKDFPVIFNLVGEEQDHII